MEYGEKRGKCKTLFLLSFAIGLLLGLVPIGHAAPSCSSGDPCPPFLGQFGSFGSEAGLLKNPRGIAADPDNGHIFVAESGQPRISEFTAGGDFVKAWGWGVVNGAAELQVCTTATGCQAGVAGAAAGQFSSGLRPMVDEAGFIWVLERANLRLQKFTPAGAFVLMVGGEVNKTRVEEREEQEANAEPVTVTEAEENLCTAASGDECGVGTSGTGDGQFQELGLGNSIALAPGGTIYVGDKNRIQKFDEDGTYAGDIDLPGAGTTRALTVAPSGRLYVISDSVTEKVSNGSTLQDSRAIREIGPAGEELGRLVGEWQGRKTPKDPVALAADADGNVYVVGKVVYDVPVGPGEDPKWKEAEEVVAFGSDGALISFDPLVAGFGASADSSDLVSISTNTVMGESEEPGEVLVGHFETSELSYVRSYGTPFEKLEDEPEVADQYVLSATASEAMLEALINPRFTTDTTYQVEYGTGKCSEGGCEAVAPVPPAQLGGGGANVPQKAPVTLSGLEPGTVYHYRFSAQNGKGGPVLGEEGTFRTFEVPVTPPGCPNASFLTGAAALLPDCRAYEMVSPVDKEGGEIFVLPDVPNFPAEINQGNPTGSALTYSSYRAFADPDSAPYTSQYIARRDAGGWINEPISPPREGVIAPGLETQYRAFSEDLSESWLVTDSEPVLAQGGLPGYRNLYRRESGTGSFEAQCTVAPEGTSAFDYRLEPQGFSADGSHLVFWAEGQLPGTGAAPGKVPQLYECVNGTELRLVSVLPGGEASAAGGSAGTANGGLGGFGFRQGSVLGAVSEDGSRIFWTATATGPGPLYVRIGGTNTVEIAPANAHFRAASPDGTRVIYSVGDQLFEASVGAESAISTQIADEVEGVMGTSEDTQLVYLISEEDLDGGGPGQGGENNLYLYRSQADTYSFIGGLSGNDARELPLSAARLPVLTPVALSPYNRSSRVSADGLHAAFTSTAPLTGFNNTDQANGEALAEVFLYDASSDELLCASCNPAGARPRGANVADPVLPFWSAAHIPGWENQLHASRVLSEDGNRLFFEATDRLALEDTNGVQDVYQWQAPGSGSCKETSPTYSPANGGCVDLISSGKSPQPSQLVDASADGSDVFFKTTESLWAGDPGLADIYDARIGGGFPPPPPPPVPCQAGVNCQQRGPAPPNPPPATSTFVGPADAIEKPRPKPKKCRKGTHKVKKAGKVRCVKNKAKRKASKSRRATR